MSEKLGALASVLEPVVPVDAIPVVTVDEQVLRFYAPTSTGCRAKMAIRGYAVYQEARPISASAPRCLIFSN